MPLYFIKFWRLIVFIRSNHLLGFITSMYFHFDSLHFTNGLTRVLFLTSDPFHLNMISLLLPARPASFAAVDLTGQQELKAKAVWCWYRFASLISVGPEVFRQQSCEAQAYARRRNCTACLSSACLLDMKQKPHICFFSVSYFFSFRIKQSLWSCWMEFMFI